MTIYEFHRVNEDELGTNIFFSEMYVCKSTYIVRKYEFKLCQQINNQIARRGHFVQIFTHFEVIFRSDFCVKL